MAFILKSIILAGISFESLLQKLMLFPMAVSILGFLAGSILPISPDQALKGATGWNREFQDLVLSVISNQQKDRRIIFIQCPQSPQISFLDSSTDRVSSLYSLFISQQRQE